MTDMNVAYKVAALAVRQRFAEQHSYNLKLLNRITSSDIAVYSGSYDKVEDILSCLNLPHEINPEANKTKAEIIFVNCSSSYDGKLIEHLKKQVENGKWLVSSDWALGHFVAKAFPGTVGWNQRSTGDEVISVEPSLDSLWSEVVVLGADPQWWLESASHPIAILNPKVRIEAASHDLLSRHNAPVVAVSFEWGMGHVYHVISHFYCKRSRALTARHREPCTDFLKAGMQLSDVGIEKVLKEGNIQPDTLNFAQLQSAATSTKLIAQLCIQAVGHFSGDSG